MVCHRAYQCSFEMRIDGVDMMDVDAWIGMFNQAYALWQSGDYQAAEERLQSYGQQQGVRTLRGQVLMAYILRDTRRYVSEIQLLHDLLQEFADSQECNLLAECWSMLGSAQRMLGQTEKAVESFLQSVALEPDRGQKLVEGSNAIFTANASAEYTPAAMHELYECYRFLLADYWAQQGLKPFGKPTWSHERIRVGYMSADLHEHPVAQFVRPLFSDYDRGRFEVYVYSLSSQEDGVTRTLRESPVVWRNVGGGSQAEHYIELERLVRSDEIDILVDLSGHTSGTALPLFGLKVAPVQICGIGYFNSTGLHETTGFLSDRFCAEAERSPFFTEPLLRLPHSHFCYQPFTVFPDAVEPPCLRRGYVTFGCFNNFSKVTDDMLGAWRQILQAVPRSRLLLKHKIFDSPEGREYTMARFRRLGLPVDRIELRGMSQDYLREYGDMDIALDTSPYAGGITTCEALYMGVPVVTLVGDRHGARFGYSFLANIGFAELAADTPSRYVELAAGLAGDCPLLQLLRRTLRQRMQESPLMNAKLYMQDVEHLYAGLLPHC